MAKINDRVKVCGWENIKIANGGTSGSQGTPSPELFKKWVDEETKRFERRRANFTKPNSSPIR